LIVNGDRYDLAQVNPNHDRFRGIAVQKRIAYQVREDLLHAVGVTENARLRGQEVDRAVGMRDLQLIDDFAQGPPEIHHL
jgi:hypothetical protein